MKNHIKKINRGENLTFAEARSFAMGILDGSATNAQIGAVLSMLALRGETTDEMAGIAGFLYEKMTKVPNIHGALDIVGTGGDAHDTINVSTLAAFVCASLGVPIVKHGSKALSSKCGSFDVLLELGAIIPDTASAAQLIFKEHGIVFLFAPYFHPAFKNIHGIRQELGIRTIFNYCGPLLNPADSEYQIVGVSNEKMCEKIGEVLIGLGRKRVLVAHSRDGLDEVSVSDKTDVYDFAPERSMKHFIIDPETKYPLSEVQGGLPSENAERFKMIIQGKGSDAENEFVALNAGLGLYVVGMAQSPEEGRKLALDEICSGRVERILEKLKK